ncbi:MAG: HRDC domain-containing protein [Pirellulaceae bacterium]|nr:HRDC domain-containing protein [Pirellulaceae bacterium]
MPFRLFNIPIRDDGRAIDELNQFMRNNKVLSVDRRWIDEGTESMWCFCVDFWDGASSQGKFSGSGKSRERVDYKEQLAPDEFAVFAKLRDWRKSTAQSEAVPVYAIFTNEQLAHIARVSASDKTSLETIAGVGDAKLAKYAPQLLEVLKSSWEHETSQRPVATDP